MLTLLGIGAGILTFLLEKRKEVPMAQEPATQTAEGLPEIKQLPIEVVANVGNVSIHNADMISGKLLFFLQHVFGKVEPNNSNGGAHTISSVHFLTDGYPKKNKKSVMAIIYPEIMSILINMKKHFDAAEEYIKTAEDNQASLRCILWHNLLVSVLHEIHHAKIMATAQQEGKSKYRISWTEELEMEATEFAVRRIIDIAKTFPIEPPTNEEDPYFGSLIAEFRQSIEESEEAWAVQERELYDKNIIARGIGPNEEVVDILSFKEFLRLSCDDEKDVNDTAWNSQPNLFVTPEFQQTVQPMSTLPPAQPQPPVIIDDGDVYEYYDDLDTLEDLPIDGMDNVPVAEPQPALNSNQLPPVPEPTTMAPNNVGTFPQVNQFQQPVGTGPAQHVLPPEEIMAILKEVYMRLYYHIFTKCGFNPQAPTSFTNPGAIFDPVNIGDIPNVDKLIKGMDITDAEGNRVNQAPVNGQIKGVVFNESKLPGYWIWINCGGQLRKRTIVPQNPEKRDGNGNLKANAVKARQGHRIAYVLANKTDFEPSSTKVLISTPPNGATEYTENPFG